MAQKTCLTPPEHPNQLKGYFLREWRVLLIVALTGTIFNAGMSLIPVMQGRLIDAVASGGAVARAALFFVGTVLIIQALRLIKRYSVRVFANRTSAAMRLSLYRSLLSMDASALKKESAGDLMVRAVSDVDLTAEGMRKVTTEIFDTGVQMGGYVVSLFLYDTKLALLSLLFIPAAMLSAGFLRRPVEQANRTARKTDSAVSELGRGIVKNASLYRVFGAAARTERTYENALADQEQKSVRAGVFETSLQPVYYAVSMLGMYFVLSMGGEKVLSGAWSVGDFSACAALFAMLAGKASKVAKLFNAYQKASVSWSRVKPYLLAVSALPEAKPHPGGASLEARGVTLSVPGLEAPLVSNLSFAAKPGMLLGLTGPVASGKTALLDALMGLLPAGGTITAGGRPVGALTPAERAGLFGLTNHSPELMSLTIAENIALGGAGDLNAAIRDAALGLDLAAFPEGANTRVGNGGLTLSGGQQARVALARALYQNPPVLLLDDPFSALDRDTAAEILKNLRARHAHQTILIASHRLELFPAFDEIICLDGEGNAAVGAHEALIGASPCYRRLFALTEGGAK